MIVVPHRAGHAHPVMAKPADLPPGPWWWRTAVAGIVVRPVWIRCPKGHVARLEDHSVASDGTVTPGVQCPTDGCDFHDNARLDGWTP